MTRSPNYGLRRRPRHPRSRHIYVLDCEVALGVLAVTMGGPKQPAFSFPARDMGHAVTLVDLLKQGAFSLPLNPPHLGNSHQCQVTASSPDSAPAAPAAPVME